MAEWNGLPGLKQPRAFLEPMQQVDVGSAYESLNKAIGQVSGQIRKVIQPIMNQQAEEAGARSVTRDENGVLQVGTRFEFEEQDQVYNNAAEAAYLSQLGLDMRSNFMELRTKENLQLDPEAFRVAAEGLLEGTLENAPSGMRGAVASLFNQELARNMTDIADKAERAMFQRQESAMKAGIEAQSNEVMRLASLNALDTPEGQQALQNYISAARQQENPIWGIAPEAVQQEIENTLSIAKGYAARGAVVGIYRKSGIEAAQAAARSILAAPDMNLTPAQRHALESDIMGEIGNMESLARSRRAEAATYATANRAANDAALDAEISDYVTFGAGDPEKYKALRDKISRSYESGAINPASYGSAISKLNSGMKEAADKALKTEALVTGAAGRISAGGFDPGDTDQMKGFSAWFGKVYGDLPADQQYAQALKLAPSVGAIAPPVVDMLKPGLYAAGDPKRQVQTSRDVMAFYRANKQAAEKQFSSTEIDRAIRLEEAAAYGDGSDQSLALAVKQVDDLERVTPAEMAQRKVEISSSFSPGDDKGKGVGPERQYVLGQISSWGVDVEGLKAADPSRLEQVITDYKTTFESSYSLKKSAGAARADADQKMRSKYGPTLWGRLDGETSIWSLDPLDGTQLEIYKPTGVSLGADAPEVLYSGGLPADQAFAYQATELTLRMMAGGFKAEDYGLKSWGEVGKLQPIPAGTATPNGGVGYMLLGPNNMFVKGADGAPLIWQPDIKGAKAMADAAKAAADAAARAEQQQQLQEQKYGPLGLGRDN